MKTLATQRTNFDRTREATYLRHDGPAIAHAGIARSLRYISINYCRPIQVRDLGKIAGLSGRGFFKAFEKHVGFRPAQVLRHLRIEHAKRLLMESDWPLLHIATRCGYRSVNSFWVAFRQVAGVAPMEFQRQARLSNHLLQRVHGTRLGNGKAHRSPPLGQLQNRF